MKIGIDASSAAIEQKTGVATYITHLVKHLEALDDGNEYVIYYRLSRRKNRPFFYAPKKASTKVKLFQEPFFRGLGLDVFHGPDVRLPKIRGPKLVATVHDLFSLVSDEFADEKFRRKKIARYRDIAERADRIICVSDSTRRDFIRFFPDAEPKTCVIYEGVDEQFYPRSEEEVERVKRKFGIASDYILYVGALSKRKNIIRMCEAFHKARGKLGEELQLVLAGKLTYGREEILAYLEEHNSEGKILLSGYAPAEDLPALYSGARLFLFTTLYEGFGLPILEALACGTPVVTSNLSAMNEVGARATHRVDPRSSDEIAHKIVEAIQTPNQVAPAGSIPGWREMARRISELYREISA